MAKWTKRVVAPGAYQTPDGSQVVDAARIRHWCDTARAMIKLGIKPPVGWGHVATALPATDDDAAFWASRPIAGKLTGADVDPATGELLLHGDTPGVENEGGRLTSLMTLPDGRQVKTAIEEVSIGARDWTDGTGKVWKDALVHLALTPLPVWVPEGGQPPFEAMGGPTDGAAGRPPAPTRFSLSQVLYRFGGPPMADDNKPDPPKKDDGGVGGDGTPIKDALKVLAKIGLTLPDDTTPENLLERIVTAGTAVAAVNEPDVKDKPPVVEEPGGGGAGSAFMSTIAKDPTVQALLQRVENDDRAKRLARIAALEKRGLKPFQAKKLRETATTVRFALGTDSKPVTHAIDEQLTLLEGVLPPENEASVQTLLSTAVVEEPPEAANDPAKRADRAADEQLRNSGMTPIKKGA